MSEVTLQNELYTTPVGQILAEKRGTWKVTVLVGHPVCLRKQAVKQMHCLKSGYDS